MANTVYQQNTPVTVEWLNETNQLVWKNFTYSVPANNAINKMKVASGLIGLSADFYEAIGIASVVDLGPGSFRIVWIPGQFSTGQYAVTCIPYTQGFSCSVAAISTISVDILCTNVAGAPADGGAYNMIAIGRGP